MTRGSTPTTRLASTARRTAWRARDYAWAVRRQLALPGTAAEAARLADPPDAVGPPVVLLPGVYEPWWFLRPLARDLHAAGVRVHVLPGLRHNARPFDRTARDVGRHLREHDLHDVVLVAHSKGGLVGKATMLAHDPQGRVARLVTVNTPFDGSALARWVPTPAVRAFLPTDPALLALAAEREVNARVVAVRSVWDPHVPGATSPPGAREVVLATPGHFRALADPALVPLLLDVLGVR